jgi:phage tail sheath gpL-like
MAITFNNIPTTIRTPGMYTEIDNSRALQGLAANPHKVLILGQKTASGTKDVETLQRITSETIADGYFGVDSILGRMCKTFKQANPNTDLYAIALSNDGGVQASGSIKFSVALSHAGGVVSTNNEQVNLMVAGIAVPFTLTSGWSVADVNSAAVTAVNKPANMPVTANTNAASALILTAVQSGTLGNSLDVRFNYYDGQSNPTCFGDSATIGAMAGGSVDPDISDAWAIIENEQFQYIISPYTDATNFTALDDELEERFGPLVDKQGMGILAYDETLSDVLAFGGAKNSPYITVMGYYDSPTPEELWAANLGAVMSFYLNQDPARPLHTLELNQVLPPPQVSRFTRTERDLCLYDGISTWIVNTSGKVAIERLITTYQTNSVGSEDPSYLNVQTLATLSEIRYQYGLRMATRFIAPRFKLADDTYPVQPGQMIATPKTVKAEIISLFTDLRDQGLIENLEDFIENLIVERDSNDRDRVNVLLPPDLINQFRILASTIQFIL